MRPPATGPLPNRLPLHSEASSASAHCWRCDLEVLAWTTGRLTPSTFPPEGAGGLAHLGSRRLPRMRYLADAVTPSTAPQRTRDLCAGRCRASRVRRGTDTSRRLVEQNCCRLACDQATPAAAACMVASVTALRSSPHGIGMSTGYSTPAVTYEPTKSDTALASPMKSIA